MPIEQHKNMIPIDMQQPIWRYMDILKFESLVSRKELFFCRADKFSDPFEGSVPRKEYENRLHQNQTAELSRTHREMKGFVCVNCWHMNNCESDAMWQLYLENNEGIAIRTTYERLNRAVAISNETLYSSKIRYIDYENEIWHHSVSYPHFNYNLLVPYIHKRIEFQHEQECRIFHEVPKGLQIDGFWNNQESKMGLFILVDINILIEEIIIHPTAGPDLKQKVEKILQQNNLTFPIRDSAMNKTPYY